MKRDFNNWLSSMRKSIASRDYYTDFPKVYENIEKIKIELNILNSLIGSTDIENDFKKIIKEYPKTLSVIPLLLAKREDEIKVTDTSKEYCFNFKKLNYDINEFVKFMRLSGLFDLLEKHIISNLVDYLTGVEVGMDTNGRKNRTGHVMENLVENFITNAGYTKNVDYFKEMTKTEIENKFNLDLSSISNNGKTEKRFDFVFIKNNHIYACECNFYGSNGSKLNETARSYKTLALESKNIPNFTFVWFTDGIGWNAARHNLEETFDVLDTLYNLKDLEDGIIEKI